MRTSLDTSQPRSAKPAFRPAPVLQRKCACGGSASIDAECEECKGKQLVVQRYSAGREAPGTLTAGFAIGANLARPDSSDNPPALGHNFSQVRVHQSTDRRIQTKSIVGTPSDQHEQEADRIAELVSQPVQQAGFRRDAVETSRVG